MSTTLLKAEAEMSLFKEDFLDSHERIKFLTSTKLVGEKTKIFCNLLVFSIGFKDEGGMLFARVLVTDEKQSLKASETFDGSDVTSLLSFIFIFGRSTFGLRLLDTFFQVDLELLTKLFNILQ